MAKLKDKVKTSLDEARMLILGAQVLLGFQFRSTFEPGFEKLPVYTQFLKFGGLLILIIAVCLLILPGAFHQIVEDGEDTNHMHRFTTKVMQIALLPFSIGLGIDLFVVGNKLSGLAFGIIAGFIGLAVALFFWYGLEIIRKAKAEPQIREVQNMKKQQENEQEQGTQLKDKIEQVLTEGRVILPGAQALLGFQFATFLMDAFEKLPESSKYVHFASLSLVALSIIFLMTPAAYHRIVEHGENTEYFHRFSSRMLLMAMAPLALGISGDLFIVARKVMESTRVAIGIAGTAVVFFFGLWFGFTTYQKMRKPTQSGDVLKQEAA